MTCLVERAAPEMSMLCLASVLQAARINGESNGRRPGRRRRDAGNGVLRRERDLERAQQLAHLRGRRQI
jgi:hypothetical protein